MLLSCHSWTTARLAPLRSPVTINLQSVRSCSTAAWETAKRLFIHRNSLLYRVQRIEELTALDLDDPATRLHLLLSYAVLDD